MAAVPVESPAPPGIEPVFPLAELASFQRIVLYPAASGARYFLEFLDQAPPGLRARIVGLGDRDPAKQGTDFAGLPVVSPEGLADLAPDCVLVASVEWRESILHTLDQVLNKDTVLRFADQALEYLAFESRRSRLSALTPRFSCEETLARLSPFGPWYNQMPFGNGIYTRSAKGILTYRWLDWMGLPQDLSGKTVLDLGAWEGFYSFECEARGAADVLAVDGPGWRAGELDRFLAARALYGSSIRHDIADIETLSPQRHGTFDLTLCLGLFYNLPDPFLCMRLLADMTKETMILVSQVAEHDFADAKCRTGRAPYMLYRPGNEKSEDGRPAAWWRPNRECLVEMVRDAGFSTVEVTYYNVPPGQNQGGIALKAMK